MEETIANWIKPPNVEMLICKVTQYFMSHSSMQIEVFNPHDKTVFYINFLSVRYFDGPMGWQGADFNVQEQKECLEILERIGVQYFEPDTLFVCRIINSSTPTAVVRIIADLGFISEQNLFPYYKPADKPTG